MPHASYKNLTWTGTVEDDSFLGQVHRFNVKDYLANRQNPSSIGAATCEAVLLLNKSGTTLARGSLVLPSATLSYEFPLATAGLATTNYCGAVSPWIAQSTVANGAGFWLVLEGVTKLAYTGSGTVLRGSFLESAASGRATLLSSGTLCGISREAIDGSAAGTLFHAHLKRF